MAHSSSPRHEKDPMAIDSSSEDAAVHKQSSFRDASGGGPDHPATNANARLPYVSQFSATASFILNRMKYPNEKVNLHSSYNSSNNSQPDKDESEDIKAAGLTQSRNGSLTMPLPTPANFTSTSFVSGDSMLSQINGIKRKRAVDVDDNKVDFSQNTISFPTPAKVSTQPPSALTAATGSHTSGSRNCYVCSQGSSLPQNLLVTCGRCFSTWHQQCASPQISDEACSRASFECADCISGATGKLVLSDDEQQHRRRIESMRNKRFSHLPQGVVPAKATLVGFGAGQSSDFSRTEYFYSKKKTDLLNVLSFCDQLKPQLLVDILVSVSRKHPDLPMFDSPEWEGQLLSTDSGVPNSAAPKVRADNKQRHGHTLAAHKIKQKQRSSKKAAKTSQMVQVGGAITYGEEDALPPTWHKAGEGLYAKLAPEVDDRMFLIDENDEEAFSQFLVDNSGKQIIETVLNRGEAVVG